MDTTKPNTISVLCCAGDFCKQQGGQAIIGMSHKCIGCDGRLHGYPCSNEKTDEMNGMTCKQCDADAMDTEETGKREEAMNDKRVKETDRRIRV